MNLNFFWNKRSAAHEAKPPPRIDRHYVSEFEQFMALFLEEHPEIPDDQAEGRGMYWDRRVDLGTLEKGVDDAVPVEPYSYYSPRTGTSPAASDGAGRAAEPGEPR